MENIIKDKSCLVTGGGGSIGSEIVRTLKRLGAREIIALDISENNLYKLVTEVEGIKTVVASIRDKDRINEIFDTCRPHIVFHAAAHKHVPFMEENPCEAVKNNILGTRLVAQAAQRYGAERFVLISTDKAVEPVSVMGASKRVCEMMMREMAKKSETVFTTVRFGNVYASEGSVVPLFKRQIEKGTVTVTHKDAERYFMTIPQAAYLAVSSALMAKGGEVFVFDMGKSVKILGLAESMIKESGKEVTVVFTGLRQGDKLKEKLLYDFETPERTEEEKVSSVEGSSIKGLFGYIKKLTRLAADGKGDKVKELLMKITDKEMIE